MGILVSVMLGFLQSNENKFYYRSQLIFYDKVFFINFTLFINNMLFILLSNYFDLLKVVLVYLFFKYGNN